MIPSRLGASSSSIHGPVPRAFAATAQGCKMTLSDWSPLKTRNWQGSTWRCLFCGAAVTVDCCGNQEGQQCQPESTQLRMLRCQSWFVLPQSMFEFPGFQDLCFSVCFWSIGGLKIKNKSLIDARRHLAWLKICFQLNSLLSVSKVWCLSLTVGFIFNYQWPDMCVKKRSRSIDQLEGPRQKQSNKACSWTDRNVTELGHKKDGCL